MPTSDSARKGFAMTLSGSVMSFYSSFDMGSSLQAQSATQPTEAKQIEQMHATGDSASLIAHQMAVTTSFVDSTLGLPDSSSSSDAGPSNSAIASAMRLSVYA